MTSSIVPSGDLVRRMREAAAEGLNRTADRVIARTIPLTPLEYGDLRDSIVPEDATPESLESRVVSDSPYAVPQHERLDYRHDDGQAKFLETAALASARAREPEILMADAVRRKFGG